MLAVTSTSTYLDCSPERALWPLSAAGRRAGGQGRPGGPRRRRRAGACFAACGRGSGGRRCRRAGGPAHLAVAPLGGGPRRGSAPRSRGSSTPRRGAGRPAAPTASARDRAARASPLARRRRRRDRRHHRMARPGRMSCPARAPPGHPPGGAATCHPGRSPLNATAGATPACSAPRPVPHRAGSPATPRSTPPGAPGGPWPRPVPGAGAAKSPIAAGPPAAPGPRLAGVWLAHLRRPAGPSERSRFRFGHDTLPGRVLPHPVQGPDQPSDHLGRVVFRKSVILRQLTDPCEQLARFLQRRHAVALPP